MYDIVLHSIEDGKISVLKNVTNYLGWEMINMINDSMAADYSRFFEPVFCLK